MKIWRVQNAEGRGPYGATWPGYCENWELLVSHNNDSHPAPAQDFGWRLNYGLPLPEHCDERFGFLLKSDALRWFSGWFRELRAAGFELVRVEGVVTARSRTKSGQVAFLPTDNCRPIPGPIPVRTRSAKKAA